MRVCVYTCVYVHLYLHFMCMHMFAHISLYMCSLCVCACIFIHVCVYVYSKCMVLCACVGRCLFIQVEACMVLCMCVSMWQCLLYVCDCVCIYGGGMYVYVNVFKMHIYSEQNNSRFEFPRRLKRTGTGGDGCLSAFPCTWSKVMQVLFCFLIAITVVATTSWWAGICF